jgi:RNA polymerase-binding transcription factor DksA
MPPDHEPQRTARWRQTLAAKGIEINDRLTRLLAGQNATLATLPLPDEARPGETPIDRLRRYLRLVSDAQKRLNSGIFGICLGCGAELDPLLLDERPWTERCPRCAASGQG